MVFSSLTFLFLFLPLTVGLYFLMNKKSKNLVLFVMSLVFYAWGEPIYILLMIFSSMVDYSHGLLIHKYRDNEKIKKSVLLSSIIINIGLLSFFKYSDFLISNINGIFGTSFSLLNLTLPIGISFYTFQTLSYTIDVYRGRIAVQKNFLSLATYVTLFPQLIAGPIVRYKTVADELDNRTHSYTKVAEGLKRFILGLGKKVLIANNIGLLWNEISTSNISELPMLTAWLGILAFGLQIYYDFSGYSDMAIGLGKVFGFNFCENFNYPYISRSISEFWRRWHISLGEWFRDYVYFPLGGNRCSKKRHLFNLSVVWFLTGLWHGANWNFVLWGLYFGFIIIIEKFILNKTLKSLPKIFSHVYVIFILLLGWVLFYFEDTSALINYFSSMFNVSGGELLDSGTLYYISNYSVIILLALLGSTPFISSICTKIKSLIKNAFLCNIVDNLVYIFIFIACTSYLVDSSFNPFLYFRF